MTCFRRLSSWTAAAVALVTAAAATIHAQGPPAVSAVTVSPIAVPAVGGQAMASSTRLGVAWVPPSTGAIDHYEVLATDARGPGRRQVVDAGLTGVTLAGLKAATTYAVTVFSCGDPACTRSGASTVASGTTDREFWQLQGTGSGVAGLAKIVSDGNARLSATRFGADATGVAGSVQLYYGALGAGASPLTVGIGRQHADATRPASFLSFLSRAGASGLVSPSAPTRLVKTINTGQGVPLSREMGGRVRLFFEATGEDNKSRILQLDSRDGYFGLDFNAGTPPVCATTADYGGGGGCEPVVAVGVDGDADRGNAHIPNARQFKIGWPTLDTPSWNGAAGTFMVFTTDRVPACAESPINHGYAVWDGARWNVQYQPNGCPKLLTSVQAAVPIHLGNARYKLYYGDPSVTTGKRSSPLPFVGPKKLLYADGSLTGPAGVVDFEDWEPLTAGRDVVFLWPSGDVLDATAEGYIDDFQALSPTGTLDLQVLYVTITDGAVLPFASAAILKNP